MAEAGLEIKWVANRALRYTDDAREAAPLGAAFTSTDCRSTGGKCATVSDPSLAGCDVADPIRKHEKLEEMKKKNLLMSLLFLLSSLKQFVEECFQLFDILHSIPEFCSMILHLVPCERGGNVVTA